MDYLAWLRQFKLGPFALFDTVLAFVGVLLVAPLLSKIVAKVGIVVPVVAWLWLTLPLSVLAHVLFRQSTPLTELVLDPNGGYLTKIVLLIMLVAGLRLIKRIPTKRKS